MTFSQKTILYFVGDASFFVSHRLNLIKGATEAGYRVMVACPHNDVAVATMLEMGAAHIDWKVHRSGTSLIGETLSLLRAFLIVLRTRPNLIHGITVKAILHSGICAKLLKIPFVGAISGLGYIFTGDAVGRKRILRRIITAAMKFALNRDEVSLIFQNNDDPKIIGIAGLRKVSSYHIGGSGVDLQKIKYAPHPTGSQTRVGLPARLLRDKGVYEFVDAARELKLRGRDATFFLIGDPDQGNPTSVTVSEINDWVDKGVVEWIPFTREIGEVLKTLHIVALPSSYREGFPKTLIDAAAAGRAAVTTNVPGCRDAIVDGLTGYLCPPKDARALADALDRLINNRELCIQMGKAARLHAEKHFDVDEVTKRHMEIYHRLVQAK